MPAVSLRQHCRQVVGCGFAELWRFGLFEILRNDPKDAAALAAGLHVGDVNRAVRSGDELCGTKSVIVGHKKLRIQFVLWPSSKQLEPILNQDGPMDNVGFGISNERIFQVAGWKRIPAINQTAAGLGHQASSLHQGGRGASVSRPMTAAAGHLARACGSKKTRSGIDDIH